MPKELDFPAKKAAFVLYLSIFFAGSTVLAASFLSSRGTILPQSLTFVSIFLAFAASLSLFYASWPSKLKETSTLYARSFNILALSFTFLTFYSFISANAGISTIALAAPLILAASSLVLTLVNLAKPGSILMLVSTVSWGYAISIRQDFSSIFLILASLALPYLVVGYYANKNSEPARRAFLVGSLVASLSAVLLSFNILFTDLAYGSGTNIPYMTLVVALSAALMLVLVLILRANVKSIVVIPVVSLAIVATATTAYSSTLPQVQQYTAETESKSPINFSETPSMVGEEGAGPRSEFRGFSFDMCDLLNSRDCFITHYDEIALKKGVRVAVDDILEKVTNNVGRTFPSHCHQVVHNLGQMSLEVNPSFEKASSVDPQVCGTGFTHGLWELAFNKISDEQLFSQVGTICEQFNMVTDWYRWSCHHILGHMLMTKMMDNPAYAMEACLDIVGKNQTDCLAGGWMNYFQDDYVLADFEEKGSAEEIFKVCYGAKSGPVKFFCYQEVFPAVYLLVNRSDYEAGKACLDYSEKSETAETNSLRSEDLNYTDRCIQGLARAVAVSTSYDFRKIPARCSAMPEKAQDACLQAAAASVVLNTGASSAGVAVCKHIKNEETRGYCYAWAKNSNSLLVDGPNSQNVPEFGEFRLPGGGPAVAPNDEG